LAKTRIKPTPLAISPEIAMKQLSVSPISKIRKPIAKNNIQGAFKIELLRSI